jgi:hypothetical protein
VISLRSVRSPGSSIICQPSMVLAVSDSFNGQSERESSHKRQTCRIPDIILWYMSGVCGLTHANGRFLKAAANHSTTL